METEKKKRVLFLAWGYSIHAERRMKVFAEDPRFLVTIVSTFPYEFPNTRTVLLTGCARPSSATAFTSGKTAFHNIQQSNEVIPPPSWKSAIRIVLQKLPGGGVVSSLVDHARTLLSHLIDFLAMKREIQRFQPDVIFCQTLLYPCYLGLLLPTRLPMVITFWNGDLTWLSRTTPVEKGFKEAIVSLGLKKAAAITVNSKAAFQAAASVAGPEKVHLIRYPGVDLSLFRPLPPEPVREKLGLSGRKIIFCPRGLGGYLNSDIIFEAAKEIVRSRPDVLFIMVTSNVSSKDAEQAKEMVEREGLGSHFLWKSKIPWREMPEWYSISSAIISISSNDSLPNCVIEGMACGGTMILGDIPTIREFAIDGFNAFLIPPRNASMLARKVLEVLDDRSQPLLEEFRRRNQHLVHGEMNGTINCQKVKSLILKY